jgi:segregation and condensation protein B
MQVERLKPILEALFAASDKPLSVNQIFELFVGDLEQPGKDEIRQAIQELTLKYEGSGFELKQVASGFRFQVRTDFETWVARLWEQKPPRYSRALMETLALIAYRQPITRGEIEDIRGVSVSSNIIKTLQEREWVKPLGHKEVPGRPTLYGTTRTFLDYFNLKSLNDLPTLSEIRDLDRFDPEFAFDDAEAAGAAEPDDGDSAADEPSGDKPLAASAPADDNEDDGSDEADGSESREDKKVEAAVN